MARKFLKRPSGAKPEDLAAKSARDLGLDATMLHSTSWRHSGNEVILTYIVVVNPDSSTPPSWETKAVEHVEIARGSALTPPPVIATDQVLEHALRHLAWLVGEDEVMGKLLTGWAKPLEGYIPEPFQAFGGPV